ncbi:MAG: hypothetical protein JXA73_10820, partial [Acidobacteria bacterium]|nr:hypothetical protein [Acidobacteriota bacterium]
MLIKTLQTKLEKAIKCLGASSCTFYLRDPYWTNDFQLIAMSGVNFEEPMHGFLSPDCTRKVVVEGAKEIFSNNTPHDSRLREPQLANISLNKEKQELFGDFVKREKVRSSARLISVDCNDQKDAVLFVNYSRPESFDDSMQSKIHKLFSELCANLPSIQRELHERDEKWLSIATRMSLLSGYDLNVADHEETYFWGHSPVARVLYAAVLPLSE